MIQSVTGRFANPTPLAAVPTTPPVQGPVQMTWCNVGLAWCDNDCDHCLPWLATCETCDKHGHQCGDWVVHEPVPGSGSVVTYCTDCAEHLNIAANI
ncbi:hypothetical protein ACOI1H_20690 [Loktanella sp. DJP18]|uniref:hypothetical protein n=1 Tax=Loktanella sp. DJP18 TaxID=3409788 RepID=UPI003BB5C92E